MSSPLLCLANHHLNLSISVPGVVGDAEEEEFEPLIGCVALSWLLLSNDEEEMEEVAALALWGSSPVPAAAT